jgi:hypothetical protein
MIVGNFTVTEGNSRNGQLVLTERLTTFDAVASFISGLFLIGIGGFVTFVFLSRDGPRPVDAPVAAHIAGWCAAGLFLIALGLWPLCWGFQEAFTRKRFVIDWNKGSLQSHVVVAGVSIRKRRYPFTSLETVALRNWRGGVFVKRTHWVVSFAGQKRRIDLVACEDRQKAQELAVQIASQAKIPLLDECSQTT